MSPRTVLLRAAALALVAAGPAVAQDFEGVVFGPGGPVQRNEFATLTRGFKEIDGYIKMHLKDDKLYAELRPDQFDKPMLCPTAVARGAGMGGYTLNFDEQWVLLFKRYGDKVHLVRRNVRFKASSGGPTAKAVDTTYTDSVLLALRVLATNPQRGTVLINLGDIFMQNFAELPFGGFDPSRSTWHKVKAFPHNVEIEVAATFTGGRQTGDDSVIDARGKTVVIHYGLCPLPEGGYTPRVADDRVGHFLTATKDFSKDGRDTSFVRYVNRWKLEPADSIDPKNPEKLSDPKKKIVFWIEKSVPTQYRAAVREGILEWNKAFEKIGFRDAIEVRQQENEEFDPEDIHYNTFRWIATDRGFAMGPSRANPLTGEILDADIIFDASLIRFWKQDHNMQKQPVPTASLIEATKNGWNLDNPLLDRNPAAGDAPRGWNRPRQSDVERHALAGRLGLCQCGAQMKYEMGLAVMALAEANPVPPAKPSDKPADKAAKKETDKAVDELIKQAIKYVTMHEVGHTLGLRHNFKSSTMHPNDKLHDTKLTREKGLVGSVMDYTPINLAPKGVKQGDYFSTTLGPYDYWAIQYAYTTDNDGLKEIAKKGALPGHDYATDEDMRQGADPSVHVWDLGADPMKFAMDRVQLAEELMKGLGDRVVEKGEGYQRARQAFKILLGQFGNGAYLVSNYVGGETINRDHRDDPSARDPLVPIKGDKQREALKFVRDRILTDATFQFSPKLLRQLAAERWNHWGSDPDGPEFPVYEEVLDIQKVVLRNLLKPEALARVQNNALKAENGEKPLALDEVFRCLTDGIWADLQPDPNGKAVASSVIRRNLQREHLKELTTLVLGKPSAASSDDLLMMLIMGGGRSSAVPPDARSLARAHLKELQGSMLAALKNPQMGIDATTRAHLEECQERIAKTLNASMTVSE